MTSTPFREHYAVGAVLLLVLCIGAAFTPAAAAPVTPDPIDSSVFDYDSGRSSVPSTLADEGAGDAEQPIAAQGRVMTTGDAIMGTDVLRARGITGTGMRIGVISDGLNGATASQTSGDLGWVYTIRDEGNPGGGEGTAMLEIIHDITPGATLYFHDCGNTSAEFIRAIDTLVAAGCTVIVDDIGWRDQPYFEEGDISKHLENLLANQRLVYVTSAGNYAGEHWEGPVKLDSYGLQDFSGVGSAHPYLYAYVPKGGTFNVYLQWDEPFGSATDDFDIILLDDRYPITNPRVLTRSVREKKHLDDPYEALEWTNNEIGHYVTIAVTPTGGTDTAQTIELFTYGAELYPYNLVPSDSMLGYKTVSDLITVAAVNASSPDTIEAYSSHGPVTHLFPAPTVIQKPDISAPDYVNVTGYGRFGSPFPGTSAAAPHIAALCALVWSARPDLSPADIRSALYSSAVDLGAPGYDNVYGWGRADAVAMYNQLATGTPVNTEPPSVFRKFYPKGGPASGSIGGTIIRQDASVGVPDSPIALPMTTPRKPPAKPFVRWYPRG